MRRGLAVSVEFHDAPEAFKAVGQQHEYVHWAIHDLLGFFLEITDIPEKFEVGNN
jgi:hypothetical protein